MKNAWNQLQLLNLCIQHRIYVHNTVDERHSWQKRYYCLLQSEKENIRNKDNIFNKKCYENLYSCSW